MRNLMSVVLAGLVALVASVASAEDSPRPGLLTSGSVNFTYALRDICFAYAFDGKDDVLKPGWGVSSIGWGAQTIFKRQRMQAHLIGVAGRINAAVQTENGVRRCEIEVNVGDRNAYRQRLLQLVAERREPFSPFKSPVSPNAYAFRDGWCGPPPTAASIIASTARPGDGVAMRVTVTAGGQRDPRCDRADIGPAVGAPVPALPNAAPPGSAAAESLQRALISAFADTCLPGVLSEDPPKPLDPGAWQRLTLEGPDRIARFGGAPATPYQSLLEPHLFLSDGRQAHVCVVFADAGDTNALYDAAKDKIARDIAGFDLGYEDDHSAVYCKEQTPQPVVLVVAKGSHRNDQFLFRIFTSDIVPGKHCPPPRR